MFNLLRSVLNIGDTTVKTTLDKNSFYQNETITGNIHIQGGSIEQQIDKVVVKLCTQAIEENYFGHEYETYTLEHIDVVTNITIAANETKEFTFEITLPGDTPITEIKISSHPCKVWLETVLDLEHGIDPEDRDYLQINTMNTLETLFEQIEQKDYKLIKADVIQGYLSGEEYKSVSGCYQKFYFENKTISLVKKINLAFFIGSDKVHITSEIDRDTDQNTDKTPGLVENHSNFAISNTATKLEVDNILSCVLINA